jgi:DNA-binding LacI/PurR family transcriptional regulator/signal transduction histidine kinase
MQARHEQKMIGIFTAELSHSYESTVLRGIESRAAELGYGTVTFVGSRIGSPIVSESTANVAYRLADSRNIDGLIIISATIMTYLGAQKLAAVFDARKNIPKVSVGVEVAGASSITVDGSPVIEHLVRHLVHDHGRRRFALINGPREHAEVLARRDAFLSALADEEISLDPRLDVYGNFLHSSGAEATKRLLASGVPFDALFGMSDSMAIEAIRALRESGRRVPEDVSVVGFDGVDEGSALIHPLTTAVQPLFDLGVNSVDCLCALMGGGPFERRVLQSSASIRESCGCGPHRSYTVDTDVLPADADSEERAAAEQLVDLLSIGDSDSFIAVLHRAVTASTLNGKDPLRWNDILSYIRQRLVASGGGPDGIPASVFEFSRAMIGEVASRLQEARRIAAEEQLRTLRLISASLAGAFDLPTMSEELREGLLHIGIGEGYVALFTDSGHSLQWSRLVLLPRNVAGTRTRFPTSDLLPTDIGTVWRTCHWVLEPLVFGDEPLGYMLLPGGFDVPTVYDSLKDQVSSALKGALLLEQVRTHERRLELEVGKRTRELTRTNAELKEEVERRALLEREVVEISNRTMERIGQDLHDDLCQHLAGVAMLASVAQESLARSSRPELESLKRIGALLAGSIARVKQIARGLTPTGLEAKGLAAAIESLIENARSSYPATIDFRASPGFVLPDTDRALQIYRIVQEALSNSLKHSGSDRIAVTLGREDHREDGNGGATLVIEVSDSGSGLPEVITADGMGLRIMRYRAERAGAVLQVEHNNPGTRVVCRISQVRRIAK